MDIPLSGKVLDCAGVFCGELTGLQVDVKGRKILHLLVRDARQSPARLIPISHVANAAEDNIWLRCEEVGLQDLRRLETVREGPHLHKGNGGNFDTPVILRPGARVTAHDGRFGALVALRQDGKRGAITHLLVRRRSLLKTKVIPLDWSYVERIRNNTVRLKLYKVELRSLDPPLLR